MTKTNWILLLFIILKFAIQYVSINPVYELQRDEYLHLDLGKHLAWGYLSVPPVTGILSNIINLLGNNLFWIKFFPAFFGVLIIIVVWQAVEELKGNLFALVLASLCVTLSALVRINTLYQPNSLDFFCWTFVFFTVLKYINTRHPKWLYYSCFAFAIGFLNKYNIAFLLIGIVPAILLTPLRNVFRNKHLYFAAGLALLIILPNVIWQLQNDLPVVHHMKLLANTQLVNVNRLSFLREQLLFFAGGLFVLLAAFISFFVYRPFRKYQVFFYTLVFTLMAFVYFRAKNYYAIGLYPIFFAFGAVYLEKILSNGWLRYLRIALILFPVLLFAGIYKYLLPVLSPEEITADKHVFEKIGLLRWEDGKNHNIPQDFADMIGWKELARLADSAMLVSPDPQKTIIQCDNYGQAGAINYYSKIENTNALSMNADYINWYPLDKFEIKNVVLIRDAGDDLERERSLFDKTTMIGSIQNPNAREFGTTVYLLEGAKVSINQLLKEEIMEEKASYR
ncbi:hypothetical protein BH20BAC1_BH20BAC1_18970 [soil metagenome]